jgi:hypothetical protein
LVSVNTSKAKSPAIDCRCCIAAGNTRQYASVPYRWLTTFAALMRILAVSPMPNRPSRASFTKA